MARYPDRHFDLAIVDPPFGIGESWKKDRLSPFYRHDSSYKNTKAPDEYFAELFRVSRQQIIWGANYYTHLLPERNSWLVWDKQVCAKTKSKCELAWTSFNRPMDIVRLLWDGFRACCDRHGKHPHEKPVDLYKWLLFHYARPHYKVLDTHLGSGSIAVACAGLGISLTASEINPGYFADACERVRAAALA
jgi:site-specific DNA-methyltransferase (adenine-specific)